jgi:predicted regulator of Ras-like GTPase activity (Roadblock/LC7/MglB family)
MILPANTENPTTDLRKVISDLSELEDIESAVLVEGMDEIVAGNLPIVPNYKEDIPIILQMLDNTIESSKMELQNDIFAHSILDYNSLKILVKKIKGGFTLLVVIHNQGYLSLAMLDIENSIRKINGILHGYSSDVSLAYKKI